MDSWSYNLDDHSIYFMDFKMTSLQDLLTKLTSPEQRDAFLNSDYARENETDIPAQKARRAAYRDGFESGHKARDKQVEMLIKMVEKLVEQRDYWAEISRMHRADRFDFISKQDKELELLAKEYLCPKK